MQSPDHTGQDKLSILSVGGCASAIGVGAECVKSRECEYVYARVCESLYVCGLDFEHVKSSEQNTSSPEVQPLLGFSLPSSVRLPA